MKQHEEMSPGATAQMSPGATARMSPGATARVLCSSPVRAARSIGVEIYGGDVVVLIAEGSRTPVAHAMTFTTVADGQKAVEIRIVRRGPGLARRTGGEDAGSGRHHRAFPPHRRPRSAPWRGAHRRRHVPGYRGRPSCVGSGSFDSGPAGGFLPRDMGRIVRRAGSGTGGVFRRQRDGPCNDRGREPIRPPRSGRSGCPRPRVAGDQWPLS